jgi:hypothetical protein
MLSVRRDDGLAAQVNQRRLRLQTLSEAKNKLIILIQAHNSKLYCHARK